MYVYNPDGFEPKHYLPPHLHPYADCARVLVHLVETARIYNKLHHSDFVPRKAEYLRRLVHKEMYKPIRNSLIDAGVLDCHAHYVIGKQSFGFRIGERFKDTFFRRYQLTDRAAIKRVQRVRDEQNPAFTDDTLKGLQSWLNRLEVDYESAFANLRTLPLERDNVRQLHLSLQMLRDGEFFFKSDLQGRVHTNLTNLWSGFRKFLRYNGECLVNIDIGNSQPLFFGLAVLNWMRSGKGENEYTNKVVFSPPSLSPFLYDAESIIRSVSGFTGLNIPLDLKRYLHITEQAEFYEHIMTALAIPITKESRDAFKRDFFGKVFYCKANYYTKERKAFQADFPTVLEHITRLKKDDPRNAPLALQREESKFVIGTVCKRILLESPNTPIWTIHDSILTTTSRSEFVRKVMQEEFSKLGVHPRLRVEVLAPEGSIGRQIQSQRSVVSVKDIGSCLLDGNPLILPLTPPERHLDPSLLTG